MLTCASLLVSFQIRGSVVPVIDFNINMKNLAGPYEVHKNSITIVAASLSICLWNQRNDDAIKILLNDKIFCK